MGDREIERDKKKRAGGRQKERKGGGEVEVGWKREDKAVMGQGDKGEKKTNPEFIVKERQPRSTTLSDGS